LISEYLILFSSPFEQKESTLPFAIESGLRKINLDFVRFSLFDCLDLAKASQILILLSFEKKKKIKLDGKSNFKFLVNIMKLNHLLTFSLDLSY